METKGEKVFQTLKSIEPQAISTLFGCHDKDVTVDFIGFLMCRETHQSLSLSK